MHLMHLRQNSKVTLSEEEAGEKKIMIERYYHAVEKEAMRNMILNEGSA